MASNIARFERTENPVCATVTAMAASTPKGANHITMLVNLNIVSERLPQKASIGRRFSSFSSASAMAKITLNTTTCSTCPSTTALAMFSGTACRMRSLALG